MKSDQELNSVLLTFQIHNLKSNKTLNYLGEKMHARTFQQSAHTIAKTHQEIPIQCGCIMHFR